MRVFISYRRSDSGEVAQQLASALRSFYGNRNVFFDIRSIFIGEDFKKRIEKSVSGSQVVLVLIGSSWLGELKQRQNSKETDYVEYEVALALQARADADSHVRVLPVLIGQDSLPASSSLPQKLKALSTISPIRLRKSRLQEDIKSLIAEIDSPSQRILSKVIDFGFPLSFVFMCMGLVFPPVGILGILGVFIVPLLYYVRRGIEKYKFGKRD